MKFTCSAMTDIGCARKANEDCFATDPVRGFYLVADGLGGHVAGRVASETAVGSFLRQVAELESGGDEGMAVLRTAARAANQAILDRVTREPKLRGMATTLAALWLREGSARLVHLGDSRVYLMRDGVLHALTLDHSYVCELVFRGRLTEEQARTHPNRHVILRALGVSPAPEPDLATLSVRRGDLFLLCTDGIHAQIADAEIADVLEQHADNLDGGSCALIELANDRGGHDNSTVILVKGS